MRFGRAALLARLLPALVLIVALIPADAGRTAVAPGLVAAYSFDEGAGTIANDVSGSGNRGTVSGASWVATGRFGGALSFDGTNDSVLVPNAASLQLTTGMTLSAWVNPSSVAGRWRTVVFKERPGGMTYALYANNRANRPTGQIFSGGAERDAVGTAAVAANAWTHLATTYDGSTLRLYANGVQAATLAYSGAIVSSTGSLRIGGNAIWGEWFAGRIDDVRIYNRALTAAQIQADMASALGSTDTTAPSTPTGLTQTGATATSVSLSWNASTDNTGVAGYALSRDAAPAGTTAQTSATVAGLVCGKTYSLGVAAFDGAGNQSPAATITGATAACDTTAPTVAITQPPGGSVVSGTIAAAATATDNVAVASVQFRLDGVNLGPPITTAPYSATLDVTSTPNGQHTLTAVAVDNAGNAATSGPVTVLVSNETPRFVLETPIVGLSQPTQILFTPDGRMLILERDGTVLVVQPGATAPDPTPFLQLTTVSTSDERGALGITLDPGFASNGFFYVMYTHSSLRNRVARFTAAGNVAGVGSETVLWENDVDAAIYHQGGGLQFGSDGTLYVSVGDNLDRASVQDLRSYNGKILRIRTDGSVPADNPFNDGAGPNRDAIWALGLRNPFRFAIDAVSGRMYVADVGETSTEEVNLGVRGANYGWPTCEGPCSQAGLTDPIFSYLHGGRDASITGGFVFRGSSFGSGYDGSYFYADYAQNWIRRLTFDAAGNVVDSRAFVPLDGSSDGPYGDPVYLTQGPDGALYYVDIGPIGSANGGSIRRVRNTNADQPPLVRATASPTAGPAPLSVTFSSAGTTDPEGRTLTFRWDFGDGTISTAPNPVHAYGTAGPYTARLAVSDGTNTSLSQPLSITVGSPPTPTILAPSAGATFRAGDVISYSGRATDAEDGTLPGSALAWTVVFHHEGHEHPGPGGTTGASGSFAVPTSGHDFTGTTSYELILTATDSTGLSRSTSITLTPEKVQLTIASTPPGLTVLVDDLPHATPYTFDTLIGFRHTLDATGPQTLGAARYAFSSWSDGGAKVHAIIVPTTDRTITASYAETVATGLVAAYSFDEGSGTSAADVSGNGNRGTVSGAAWAGAGKFSGALSFDGLDDIVTVPHSASLLLTTGMTLSAWVNPSVVTGSWRTVVFKERTGGMTYALYANNGSNRPVGQIFANGAERDSQGGATLPANAWSHLATTFDGTSLKLFVNGVQAGSLTSSGSIVTSTGSLRIGGNSIWAEWFRGLVDDVRIYSRALSAQEIQADMARPAP